MNSATLTCCNGPSFSGSGMGLAKSGRQGANSGNIKLLKMSCTMTCVLWFKRSSMWGMYLQRETTCVFVSAH